MGNGASTQLGPPGCGLEGSWVAIRHKEWKNRNIGSHSMRAAMPQTKMTYDTYGNGKGWVGELYVKVTARTLARGQFNAMARVPALFWSANDGSLTILPDGTLKVCYPSNGIVEYWKRGDDCGRKLLQTALSEPRAAPRAVQKIEVSPQQNSREVMLLFRRVDSFGIAWHWALGVKKSGGYPSIYEVGGFMAIIGPNGLICGNPWPSSALAVGTKTKQFHGWILLKDRSTTKTDAEIEDFCRRWCRNHPVYNMLGPNCQTFAEDLHIYLTGRNLEFYKFGDLKTGPEASTDAVWLDHSKKPKR
jgi:hypothetical protein